MSSESDTTTRKRARSTGYPPNPATAETPTKSAQNTIYTTPRRSKKTESPSPSVSSGSSSNTGVSMPVVNQNGSSSPMTALSSPGLNASTATVTATPTRTPLKMLYLTAERERAEESWANRSDVRLKEIELKGFALYAVEEWLFEKELPWVVQVLTGSPTSVVRMYRIGINDVLPQYKHILNGAIAADHPEITSHVVTNSKTTYNTHTHRFIDQQTKHGNINLIDTKQAETKKMALIPIHSGDWERDKDKIMSSVILKRFGCGSDHLGTQILKFWSTYEAHTQGISSETPISEVLCRFTVYVQKHLVFLNYLYCNTFTWGYLDNVTMRAIKRCKAEYATVDLSSMSPTVAPQQQQQQVLQQGNETISSAATATSASVAATAGEGAKDEEGYLTPQVITFLSSQVQLIARKMKSAGVGSGNKSIGRMLRLENAKLSSTSRIKHYKNERMLNWISFLKSVLGLNINESIISQYPALFNGIKATKEAKASSGEKDGAGNANTVNGGDGDDDDDNNNDGNTEVGTEGEGEEQRKEKSKKKKQKKKKEDEKSAGKTNNNEEEEEDDDEDEEEEDDDDYEDYNDGDNEKGECKALATLRRELEDERARSRQLEKKVAKLEADEEQLRSDWVEMHADYTKLQQQYWMLMYEADERSKQMNDLRQASSITNTRLLRELAKANELLNANKYSIQSNTQKVNKLDNSFREVAKRNKSFLSNVVIPQVVNIVLGCKETLKKIFFANEKQFFSLFNFNSPVVCAGRDCVCCEDDQGCAGQEERRQQDAGPDKSRELCPVGTAVDGKHRQK